MNRGSIKTTWTLKTLHQTDSKKIKSMTDKNQREYLRIVSPLFESNQNSLILF